MVLIDYYSNWIEPHKMIYTTNAEAVISCLKSSFAKFGIPFELVCDNGPPFSSDKFQEFAHDYGFSVIHPSPYYPK